MTAEQADAEAAAATAAWAAAGVAVAEVAEAAAMALRVDRPRPHLGGFPGGPHPNGAAEAQEEAQALGPGPRGAVKRS